jgi:hypothetical protein
MATPLHFCGIGFWLRYGARLDRQTSRLPLREPMLQVVDSAEWAGPCEPIVKSTVASFGGVGAIVWVTSSCRPISEA